MENTGIRLNKYIADSGHCSRREADALIEKGQVTIEGKTATLGDRVFSGQTVAVAGTSLAPNDDLVYLAVNKPAGITCTTDLHRGDNIITWLGFPQRVFPVGRLDRDSEGLIFLTNDGNIVNKILRAGNAHEKEYLVTVAQPITPEFLLTMASGVPILNTVTKPCRVVKKDGYTFRITLSQGLNRQIRRMCEYLGYEVRRLIRVRIMHVTLGNLKSGAWRYLTAREIEELHRLTERSANQPDRDRSDRR